MLQGNQYFKELVKRLESFGYTSGEGKTRIFESLIDFVVYGFCLNGEMPKWNYTPEQTAVFNEMFALWVNAAKVEIDRRGWCDIPGNLHQCYLYSKTGKGFLGQYFTPEDICSLMTDISGLKEGERTSTVYDCCCGSGRLLLSAYSKACDEKKKVYCVAKDLDPICVKMTTANFIIHGVPGEIVWGNALDPEDGRLCFLTNESINNPTSDLFGVPHCRVIPFNETMQGRTIGSGKVA